MIRGVILNLLSVVLAGAAAFAVCRAMGWDAHRPEMVRAGSICVAASILALVPLLFVRGSTQGTVSQAALAATVIHMLVCAAGGLGLKAMSPEPKAFLVWLCVFYWATLASIAAACVMAVKSARPEPALGSAQSGVVATDISATESVAVKG